MMFCYSVSALKNIYIIETNAGDFELSAIDENEARTYFKELYYDHIMIILGNWDRLIINNIKIK